MLPKGWIHLHTHTHRAKYVWTGPLNHPKTMNPSQPSPEPRDPWCRCLLVLHRVYLTKLISFELSTGNNAEIIHRHPGPGTKSGLDSHPRSHPHSPSRTLAPNCLPVKSTARPTASSDQKHISGVLCRWLRVADDCVVQMEMMVVLMVGAVVVWSEWNDFWQLIENIKYCLPSRLVCSWQYWTFVAHKN